jgi:hypothetical protein
MQEPTPDEPRGIPETEHMRLGEFLGQVLSGIGVAIGLSLLWLMEIVRDAYFRVLDRLNVKPRHHRRASAFPPGRPRTRPPASAAS